MKPFRLVAALPLGIAVLQGCGIQPAAAPAPTPRAASAAVLTLPIARGERWIADATDASGQPLRILLDTGTTFALFDADGPVATRPLAQADRDRLLAQGAILRPVDASGLEVETPTGSTWMPLGLAPALRIQHWSIPAGQLAMVSDLDGFNARANRPIDGILGIEAMRQLTWRADHVEGRLTAYADAPPAHNWQQCTFLTLETSQRMPVIPYALPPDRGGFLGIDTGSNGELTIPADDFDRMADAREFDGLGWTWGHGLSGEPAFAREGLLAGMQIGRQRLPKLSVERRDISPQIGLGVLARMDRFELDFRHYRFCFDMTPDARDSHVSTLGAALTRTDAGIRVQALTPEGRLGRSGAREADIIVTIDKTDVATLTSAQIEARLEDPKTAEIGVRRAGKMVGVGLVRM
ncbi:hypothetical protein QTN24_12110 [Cupriavidus sp. SZY C1]|uniref:hypothetical protein n=1 Tax=Cupriavidus sp. SZY C1 TaxID=3055037 RepID=UPI0028B45EC3|nr:hypothetical protein [Cupriavidus sp. SZY C1]MDT6962242.1 hypothetical protein [Cupriavidus sp. SZY C1]